MKIVLAACSVLLALASGCAEDPPAATNPALRAALDASDVSLRESVSIAESSVEGGRAIRATLLARSSVLSVGAITNTDFREIRIDPSTGEVLATSSIDPPAESCGDSVSLDEAIVAAESSVNGEAVTVAPDDDEACDREVKVLDGSDVLWEVKIAPDGSVKETEVADDADETDA